MNDLTSDRMRLVLLTALAFIVIGGSVDLALDQPQRWLSFHVVFELLMISGALLIAVTLWLGWWRSARSVRELRRSLEDHREERDAWRESAQHALQGLGRAIDRQFDRWDLTPAEREVALLLLKGYSHKAIARRTDRSDQTARQHAATVYRKAGISGRAELAAFFLEDLMLPADDREIVPGPDPRQGMAGPAGPGARPGH
ncbi:MAG: LuxR C-terminal-related transcriptional regulator [Gemmatimonadota bacterium]|jgi:DNA-binding CsgD family transcriptional regulator